MSGLFQKHAWKSDEPNGQTRVLNQHDAQLLFEAFDENKSGTIDFQEIVTGLSTLMDGVWGVWCDMVWCGAGRVGSTPRPRNCTTRLVAFTYTHSSHSPALTRRTHLHSLVALTCTHSSHSPARTCTYMPNPSSVTTYMYTCMSGDEDERIGYAFAVYDTSGDHQIDLDELTNMLMHVNGWDTNVAVTQASYIMDMFDVDDGTAGGVKDKKLSLDEFKRLVGDRGKGLEKGCAVGVEVLVGEGKGYAVDGGKGSR